ncbi:putative ABC transporter ATP-binding protein [Legionella parisiensis]|uniref:Putative ABC transporter ATP-binding protein n=2 Tax=Legionella parisiensis TaxID=45071 RepID=A0A1E5JL61_9GAMM|nr:putative ABC transporter ATP-binding protein [Legionella parisiensis]
MDTRESPVLHCMGIGKTYKTGTTTLSVLDNFSLALQPGEIGMLMGASGCGKTTLLMIAGGILSPDQGTCSVSGNDLNKMSPKKKLLFVPPISASFFNIFIYFQPCLPLKI